MNTTHLTIEQITEIATKAAVEAVHAALRADQPAKVTKPAAVKAPATTKVYRSAKGKAQAKVEVAEVWEQAKAKAGVKRVKDLTPKQRAAADAKVKAIWAAVPKTRSTKA